MSVLGNLGSWLSSRRGIPRQKASKSRLFQCLRLLKAILGAPKAWKIKLYNISICNSMYIICF